MRSTKTFGVPRETMRQQIAQTKGMQHSKSGSNNTYATRVFLFDEYALLKMKNIRLRNVATRDCRLKQLSNVAQTLLALQAKGVNVVPILAFRSDGYILQKRAMGEELYDNGQLQNKQYVLRRVETLAAASQAQYNQFVADTIQILDAGLLIDFRGKDNFFYHEQVGFQFVDLNAHNDFVYGLTDEKPQTLPLAAWHCFLPCYFDAVPDYRNTVTPLLAQLTTAERAALTQQNKTILAKCKTALQNNGATEEILRETFANEHFAPQLRQLGVL